MFYYYDASLLARHIGRRRRPDNIICYSARLGRRVVSGGFLSRAT